MDSGHVVWGQVEQQDSASSSSEQHSNKQRNNHPLMHVAYLPDPSQESSSVVVSGAASSAGGSQGGRRSSGTPASGAWGDQDDEDDTQDDESNETGDDPFDDQEAGVPIGGVWSKGCDLHKTGTCRPCHYVATKAGCMNGAECEFCHLPHPRRARQRPCKTKRLQFKRVVNRLAEANRNSPEEFQEALSSVTSQSEYLRGLIRKRLHTQGGAEGASASSNTRVSRRLPEEDDRSHMSASSSVNQRRHILSL